MLNEPTPPGTEGFFIDLIDREILRNVQENWVCVVAAVVVFLNPRVPSPIRFRSVQGWWKVEFESGLVTNGAVVSLRKWSVEAAKSGKMLHISAGR